MSELSVGSAVIWFLLLFLTLLARSAYTRTFEPRLYRFWDNRSASSRMKKAIWLRENYVREIRRTSDIRLLALDLQQGLLFSIMWCAGGIGLMIIMVVSDLRARPMDQLMVSPHLVVMPFSYFVLIFLNERARKQTLKVIEDPNAYRLKMYELIGAELKASGMTEEQITSFVMEVPEFVPDDLSSTLVAPWPPRATPMNDGSAPR